MIGPKDDSPNGAALFEAANKLRGSVESAEYKHLVLGLLFLKYISDSFELRRAELGAELSDPGDTYVEDPDERAAIFEDRDEYVSHNAFWVPERARWDKLLAAASQPDIAKRIDDALAAIEHENPGLRNVLPRIYARATLSADLMGSLVETIAKIGFGTDAKQSRDILGRTYEYFIKEFARAEGHRGGEFFTPAPVARLLVEMLEPYQGRVLDPACGSCGLFVQSARFIEAHGGRPDKISIYGQERNQATWRIGRMNLAIHGLSGDVKYTEGGSLLDDAFSSVRADFVMANPPFNQSEWSTSAVLDDARWVHGSPPEANANYAWMQHFLHHLAPTGRAGFVMANGSLTTRDNGEHLIRERLVRANVVDCIVELPNKLFFTTQIPVCLWFLDRSKARPGERDRTDQVLFLDARSLGTLASRTQRVFTDDDIQRIAGTYHAWRGQPGCGLYEDVPGFCRSEEVADIEAQGFFLAPGAFTTERHVDEEHLSFDAKLDHLGDVLARRARHFAAMIEDDVAHNLYRSWFIDFDPITAWREERKPLPGLDATEMALFGDDLVDTEAGRMPPRWEVVTVYDLADVTYGASYASRHFNEKEIGIPLLRIRDLGSHNPKVFTSEDHPKGTVIEYGDIVCGMDGEFRVQRWKGPDSVLNQRVCTFRPKPGVPHSFLAAAVERPIAFYERSKTGTTVIHLLKRDIDQIRLPLPPTPLLEAFDREVQREVRVTLAQASGRDGAEPSLQIRREIARPKMPPPGADRAEPSP